MPDPAPVTIVTLPSRRPFMGILRRSSMPGLPRECGAVLTGILLHVPNENRCALTSDQGSGPVRIDRGSADPGSRPRQGDAPGGAFDAVVFDLDGTLADTAEDLSDAMNRVLRGRGFAVHDVDAYEQMVGKGIRNLVTVALPPGARDEATVTACNDELLADYGEHCLVKTRLYPGITNCSARSKPKASRWPCSPTRPKASRAASSVP